MQNQPVTIYISAASDLMTERETLAQMIAKLPVTLAWRILQSPLEAEYLDLEALQAADLHFLLIGMDIRAPIGLEWQMARYARREIVPFLKKGVARTMAGESFVRETRAAWHPFTDNQDLVRQAQARLIEHLLRHLQQYRLTPVEVEQLQALEAEGEQAGPAGAQPDSVAGRSAVILSRERYEPSEGILIEGPDQPDHH